MPAEKKNIYAMTGLSLETSAKCQLNCPLCFLRSYDYRPAPDLMPLEVVEAVLPFVGDMETVDLTGWGEPLLNPVLFNIVETLRARFSGRLSMTTNGQLLDAVSTRKLVDLGLDVVCVSVDAANEDSYKKVRPGGDFIHLRKNIDELVAQVDLFGAGKPLLFATFLLRKDFLSEANDFVSLISAHGLDGVVLQQLTGVFSERGMSQATHCGYYGNDFDQTLLDSAVECALKAAPAGFTVVGPESIGVSRVGDCGGFDITRPFITAAGKVSVCCAMAYPCSLMRRDGKLEYTDSVVFGDVRETSLDRIFAAPEYVEARRQIRAGAIPKACGDCIALYTSPGKVWVREE